MRTSISVIIPTMNEEEAIVGVITRCNEVLKDLDYEIIVVDKSVDKTPELARNAGANVIRQTGSGGVGQALTQGFSLAKGKILLFLDGDGTYMPEDIRRLLEPVLKEEADLVNGNRFANMERGAMTTTNYLGNRLLTWVGNLLFNTGVKDSQSGMKAFRKELLDKMILWESGFAICSEILAEAGKLGARIVEVPITYKKRVGKTKLSPARAGGSIVLASMKLLREHNPLLLFGSIGAVLILIGFVAAIPVIVEYAEYRTFTLVGRALLAALCWISGILSVFTGFILNAINYSLRRMEERIRRFA